MAFTLENFVVLLIVALAVLALARRFYKFLAQAGRGGAACGSGCGDCGEKTDNTTSAKPLVELDVSFKKPY